MFKKFSLKDYNFKLLILVIIAVIFGTVLINSADSSFTMRQIIGGTFAIFVMVFVSFINYDFICKFYTMVYAGVLAILALVLLFGVEVNSAKRWINVGGENGVQFQPSEFAKLGMIVSMIFRLVPMYAERYEKVSAANRINPDKKSGIKVMSAVFTNSLEGSVDMTLSMTDRGYDFRRTRYSRYSFGVRDVVFLCIIILFQGMYFGRGMGLAIVRSIYFMLPLIWDGKECLKWLCMKNRIFQLNREN